MVYNSTHSLNVLSLQDSRIHPPSCKTYPDSKFDPFLKHVQQFSIDAWLLGVVILIDEQTIELKGMHVDKLQITYKMRVTSSNVILCAQMDILSRSTFDINWHLGST